MPTLTWKDKALPTSPEKSRQPALLEQWPNPNTEHRLICTDNIEWLHHAQENGELFDLIYMDPPFCSGANYTQTITIDGIKHNVNGFGDIFTVDDYLQFIYERIVLLKAVLRKSGSIFVHCDYQQSHNIRAILDEVFGAKQFRNEIIWHYTGGGRSKKYFSRKHDSIFWYSHGDTWTFNTEVIRIPYKATSGFAKGGITSKSGKKYLPNPKGTLPDDTWDIPILNPLAKERTGYPTQKPLPLLERIVLACSNPGDRILDPFMGSGTTGIAAVKHKRKFVGLDQNWNSIHLMRRRLLGMKTDFSIYHTKPIKPTIDTITIHRNGLHWSVQSKTPIQEAYALQPDDTWSQELLIASTKILRIIDLKGNISDFTIPNQATTDTMALRRTV